MIARPCIVCGRHATYVMTAPGVAQHLCDGCLTARSEKMPQGFPKPLKPVATIPTREPKTKRSRKRRPTGNPTAQTPSTRKPTTRRARKDT